MRKVCPPTKINTTASIDTVEVKTESWRVGLQLVTSLVRLKQAAPAVDCGTKQAWSARWHKLRKADPAANNETVM